MATNLTRNPLVLDASDIVATLGALPATVIGYQTQATIEGKYGGPSRKIAQRIAIGVISWTAVDAVQHDQVILQDLTGHEIWRSAPATGGDFPDQFKFSDGEHFEGLVVVQLPHGVVEVHYR